jgi:hypothetical protein
LPHHAAHPHQLAEDSVGGTSKLDAGVLASRNI